jgi:hypothetical protein
MITKGIPRQRQIFFEGNSLFARATGGAIDNGHFIPSSVYGGVISGRTLAYQSLAIAGRTQTQINAAIGTNITPYVRHNDVIVLWEGTNDMYVNDLSGAAAYANLITYRNAVVALGAKLVVATVIARDYVDDDVDLMDRIDAYNALVMANSSLFEAVCALHQDAAFNARADAANLTYYNADKIHQAQGGQDLVVTLLTPVVEGIL